eukprot:CAMPEP_0174891548 /NCGR_PEP_ID=MMETSP0167-20121228/6616_1 /TAXON_ID=38298 /ORGANISM="Rhodella maculata, Strain CCMP736" /LENGTH=140 /DNA_ID=CAMNT_0016129775 /DNA_START=566 /DNA_END=984 /DNA_ORIENTATION=-
MSNHLPLFSGSKVDFPDWQDAIIQGAADASIQHPLGLRGFLLPAEEYSTLDNTPFIPVPNPGPLLDHPNTADGQRAAKTWKRMKEEYLAQQQDLLLFTKEFTRSLPAEIQRLLIHPNRGATYTLAQRYAILVSDFGTLTA